tara:strand:+ start:264 stop:2510 length:2247 start_codon:yes stop_codon:yes gene_type:complete
MKSFRLVLLSSVIMMPAIASAQTSDDPSNVGIQDIVVTAQKRSERLQDVPASITALSAESLEAGGITSAMDLPKSTPGLTFGSTAVWTNFYMRGIGTSIANAGAQSPVAFYVDGVYLSDTAAIALGLDDVERVEILKGPQGTLYGRNALGGAINVITRQPPEGLDVRVKASVGNFDNRQVTGYIGVGDEKIGANFTINRHLRDGYYKNVAGGADLNDLDNLSMRGKIRFTPTDDIELTVAADYSLQKGGGPGTTNLVYASDGTVVPTGVLFGGIVPTKPWETSITGDVSSRARDEGLSLTGRFGLGSVDLVSVTSIRDFKVKHGVDFDATNATVAEWRSNTFRRQFSQELQLLSNGDGPFNWITGLYYLHDKAGMSPFNYNNFGSTGLPFGTNILINTKVKGDSYAAFAEGTYDINDEFSVIVGARYSKDKLNHYDARQTVTLAPPNPPIEVVNFDSSGAKKSWDAFTPKVTLKYDRPEGLYYITASKGYSSGLFNITNIAPTRELDIPVDPQRMDALEVGAKWQLFNNSVQVNLAGFYYKIKDLQTFQIAGNATTTFENAGAKIKGIDMDVLWQVSPYLNIRGAFEILDGKYRDYQNAGIYVLNTNQGIGTSCNGVPGTTPLDSGCPASVDLSGQRLLRSPKFTSTVGFDYTVPFVPEDSGKVVFTGNWNHSSSYLVSVNASIVSPKYDMFSAAMKYTSPDERWSFSLWGNNLSNAKYYTTGGDGNYGRAIMLNAPRMYGITAGVDF